MIWLYNVCRTTARICAGGFFSTLTAGKLEVFGLHFGWEAGTALAAALGVVALLSFCAESWSKKRAGL